jgi:hypothetical protein
VFFELKNTLTQALINLFFLHALLNNASVTAADAGFLTKHWKAANSSAKYFTDHVAMVVVDKVFYCENVERLRMRGNPEAQICRSILSLK